MPRRIFLDDFKFASIPGIFPRLKTSEYPKAHQFFVFGDDGVSEPMSTALSFYQPYPGNPRIERFLTLLSRSLDKAILDLEDSQSPSEYDDEDDIDCDDTWNTDNEIDPLTDTTTSSSDLLRSDLKATKAAGYKVGVLGDTNGSIIVCISCRIGKLGVSAEALQAWNVKESEYLVFLIRYPLCYIPMAKIISQSLQPAGKAVQMRVGICSSYKPSWSCAVQQFNWAEAKAQRTWESRNRVCNDPEPEYRSLQIVESINKLLDSEFFHLLNLRIDRGFSWVGAEAYLHATQSRGYVPKVRKESVYYALDDWSVSTPSFLKDDHFSDKDDSTGLVFPLIGMHFVLRRFVKCTEFCLNCYRKVDCGFEAIKPYVCSSGLCLYQYMNLGMGPSVEWEILSQPYVADMLISFTYCRASAGKLKDFPCGIGLRIPTGQMNVGTFDRDLMELRVEESAKVRTGSWIRMVNTTAPQTTDKYEQWCCEVRDTNFFPVLGLASTIHLQDGSPVDTLPPVTGNIRYEVYDKDFDGLNHFNRQSAIIFLLRTLPPVDEMRDYIAPNGANNVIRDLSSWHNRVSPAALGVLRWIIASNRSCILYENDPKQKVSGMDGYLQFRLAQGAPDKEARFVQAVKAGSEKSKYPSLFGWHGSPLHNWHSILREGLHFKEMVNGRSCGNGVYMAQHFNYSLDFASKYSVSLPICRDSTWPQSNLRMKAAVSLNEVVNRPQDFLQASSGYLVVAQLNWIQPRYLFVSSALSKTHKGTPSNVYQQDPDHQTYGPVQYRVKIPISALATHRGRRLDKKGQQKQTDKTIFSDTESVATLADDQRILGENDGNDKLSFRIDLSKTDFRPGSLDVASLQLLGPPKYATSTATKALHKRLQETLKVQQIEPLQDLGWYINPDLLNNVYQWIVELHSFDQGLPLAKDLRKTKINSIVIELRYPPQFPISPPFVRIIRPRILSFRNGGGGHVTQGGSMCMELLTNSGWSAAFSMENVFLQVRLALSNTEPQPARLDSRKSDYNVGEAISDYIRVCQAHGWTVPDDLQQVSWA
ncbi:hypothetical protein BDV59DRAFT_210390 [Aspergillus ambiguus]|uniref:putative ubiquitin conjugating enzyme n=1 Tax=Aspergillus ambiguus TaxID=176160 RepID=UPI003CCDCDC6